jgi:hypothetical protein
VFIQYVYTAQYSISWMPNGDFGAEILEQSVRDRKPSRNRVVVPVR